MPLRNYVHDIKNEDATGTATFPQLNINSYYDSESFDLYLVFENAVTAANFVNRHKRLGNLTISFDDSIITNFTALYTNPTIDHPDFEKRTVHLTFIKRLK